MTRTPPTSMPLSLFVGRSRTAVEGLLGTRADSTGAGWVVYGDNWALLYEGGCAVELRARVESGIACAEAAALLGFGEAGAPLRHVRSCEWPGISERHVLGPGLTGALDIDSGIFHARRVGDARRCDESTPVARRQPPTASSCRAAPDGASPRAHLQTVADCFHAAVLALGREPARDESLAAFLAAANLNGTPPLVLSDGAAITVEAVAREHDDYDDGRSDFVTTYRFSAPGHAETAETTLVLSVGDTL